MPAMVSLGEHLELPNSALTWHVNTQLTGEWTSPSSLPPSLSPIKLMFPRKQFGRPLASNQLIQKKMADMLTEVSNLHTHTANM